MPIGNITGETITNLIEIEAEINDQKHKDFLGSLITNLRDSISDTEKRYDNDPYHENVRQRLVIREITEHIREKRSDLAIKLLSTERISLDSYTSSGNTIASVAAYNNDIETLRYLYDEGADLFKASEEGYNTFNCFASMNLDTLRFASSLDGFNPNEVSEHGVTPIQQCIKNLVSTNLFGFIDEMRWDLYPEKLECISLLIELGADVNHVNEEGRTVLMSAAFSEAPDIVRRLLEAGADPSLVCNNGNRAVDYSESEEVIKILQQVKTST
ncbi:ankyrin repeat domain-containing protein [Vibrio parahaemolyticus]|uniref:Ankyrin repeat domain-containing protein n=1 Tax=Vibrio parahaemolyticus TaxID=670 RepID=A0AAW8Q8J8_VIBPH|nr:ankyrin repeat domain-containing protein [Vibrio parahaemolyticus]MDS1823855.1 ankyrin repeat domain-containing protein [Vibrio parahaemolyticus]